MPVKSARELNDLLVQLSTQLNQHVVETTTLRVSAGHHIQAALEAAGSFLPGELGQLHNEWQGHAHALLQLETWFGSHVDGLKTIGGQALGLSTEVLGGGGSRQNSASVWTAFTGQQKSDLRYASLVPLTAGGAAVVTSMLGHLSLSGGSRSIGYSDASQFMEPIRRKSGPSMEFGTGQDGFLGARGHQSITGSSHGLKVGASADEWAGVEAQDHVGVSLNSKGLQAAAAASVAVGMGASGSVTQKYGIGSTKESVTVFAGAKAGVDGTLHVGPKGADVAVGAHAFAGAQAGATGSVDVGGAGVGGGVHAYAGVGATAEAKATVSESEVKVSLKLGVALGVGTGADVNLDVHPAEVAHNVEKLVRFL